MDATFTKGKTCVKACEVIAINRDLKSKYEAYIIWIILHNLFQRILCESYMKFADIIVIIFISYAAIDREEM